MLQPLEGSQALALAVARCRPGVVAAYPITPQTHIVENISKLVADGVLRCELVSVESEFSAASVVLGAAAAGARAYTASSSQGLLLMAEVLYNIAGMRIPMVLTCANRALSAPLSIWNDHQDAMAVRDAGWIQLFCASNQEAVDTTIQAFRIAERTELPVMVNVDGFVLTHTLEPIDIPEPEQVDGYLPPYVFSRALDPTTPQSMGTLVTPDYFAEVRHSHHQAMVRAMPEIVAADEDWGAVVNRSYGGLLREDGDVLEADLGILAMGSAASTLRAAMDVYPHPRRRVKLIILRAFRPFPEQALRDACEGLKDLVVVDRAVSPGGGGILGTEVRAALSGLAHPPRVTNVAAGLGGRDMPLELYQDLVNAVPDAEAPAPEFRIIDVDLDKLPAEDR